MQSGQPVEQPKVQENQPVDEQAEVKCGECSKKFPKQVDLDTHTKMKHDKDKEKEKQTPQVPKAKPAKSQTRNRVLEMQQNEHEDAIYSYLGQLGEKNQESSAREDLLLTDQNQRQSIQTNYSFNKVVRTPYQKEIVEINLIPKDWISASPHKEFIENLVTEMTVLYYALQAEKQKWQYRDPMAPEEEAEDEFSLMEIRKLIQNYPRRKLILKYPHFSIFLLWVGRICKPLAWEEFFMIISTYLAEYYSKNLPGKPADKWEAFNNQFQAEPVKPYLMDKLSICDEKTVKKFADFFCKWTQLFDLVNEFC